MSYWIMGGYLYCIKIWLGLVLFFGRFLSFLVNFFDKIFFIVVFSVFLLGSWWVKYVGFFVFCIGVFYKEIYFLLIRGGVKRFGDV